ncbi:uncharacterized protein LOC116343979 [Contarinia nasturtii]|uniref:uncharacterized protein LOC116343979 n=1 Tax=Contarinia nasturtii TaxID=265458 RepID=UPI0012D4B428|nr:uncharacterized protein LOC116343979 [Contarinia nasturtii]XP_031628194.1 uncharacterized protein LOC116343979 [Contarinia nasturtii]XP_031628203.1 uncharacterized protein LOC116343979 [Contarinia nasturtii]
MQTSTFRNDQNDQRKQVQLLTHFFGELINEEEYAFLKNDIKGRDLEQSGTIVDGFKRIIKRKGNYKNAKEFCDDIKSWTERFIRVGKKSKKAKAATWFRKTFLEEANTIEICADCYAFWKKGNPKTFFKQVCDKPHLLLYVQVEGYPIWPAKLMMVKGRKAVIQCFGDHEEADNVPFDKCFLYSKEIPVDDSVAAKNMTSKQKGQLKLGYKEVSEHIGLIKQKFGSFVPVSVTKKPMTNVKNHLIDMFPGVYAPIPATSDGVRAQSKSVQRAVDNGSESGYSDDMDYQNWPENPSTQIKLEPLVIQEVIPAYQEFDAEEDDLQAENGDNVQNGDYDENLLAEANGENKSCRKRANSTGEQANSVPKKKGRASEIGHSSGAIDDAVIIIQDDEANINEKLFDEYEEIFKKIQDLEERKASIKAKLKKSSNAKTWHEFDDIILKIQSLKKRQAAIKDELPRNSTEK